MDNLFVVVDNYDHYSFKESKVTCNTCLLQLFLEAWLWDFCWLFVQEETLKELQELASKLPWTNALEVWRLNRSFKKKKGYRKGGSSTKIKPNSEAGDATAEEQDLPHTEAAVEKVESIPEAEDSTDAAPEAKVIKFRVTCSRAGDKHSFSSNEAARDFGGAVQEFFQWKADMTKFDVEVALLDCSDAKQKTYHSTSPAAFFLPQLLTIFTNVQHMFKAYMFTPDGTGRHIALSSWLFKLAYLSDMILFY